MKYAIIRIEMPKTALFMHGPLVRTSRLLLEGFLLFASKRGWQVKNLCPPRGAGADYLRRIATAWDAVGIAVDCGAESAMPIPDASTPVPAVLVDLDPAKRALFAKARRGASGRIGFVDADSEAIVRIAAKELLQQDFVSYAYVSSYYSRHWSERRISAVRRPDDLFCLC